MSLRSHVLAAGLTASALAASALTPTPALARDADARELDAVASKLSDPGAQMAVAAMLAGMSEAMLDLRIGPMVRAVENLPGADRDGRLRDIPADARLRDVAGLQAERMPAEIARATPMMMGAMAGMARAFGDMMPEFKRMAERMKDSMPRERD